MFESLRSAVSNAVHKKKLDAKIAVTAEMTELGEAAVRALLATRAIAGMPNKPFDPRFRKLDLKSVRRVGDNLMRIELERGRTFFGHRSEQKHYVYHHLLKQFAPEAINGDAYKLAMDIQTRYLNGQPPRFVDKGAVLIEGGCYTGMKAIRWHDALEGDCTIHAVEIGATNVEIMRMNIDANRLGSRILPLHCGLWRETGTGEQLHNFTTRRFLEATDRWEGDMVETEPVRLLSIDDLLDERSIDVADFLNIQVNGAEIEVLKGFTKLDRVKVVGVAAYYAKGDTKNADVVREMILKQGCTILHDQKGRITYATPKHAADVAKQVKRTGI